MFLLKYCCNSDAQSLVTVNVCFFSWAAWSIERLHHSDSNMLTQTQTSLPTTNVSIQICARTHTHTHTHALKKRHVHIHKHMHTHTACTHTHTHTHTHTTTWKHTHTQTHIPSALCTGHTTEIPELRFYRTACSITRKCPCTFTVNKDLIYDST